MTKKKENSVSEELQAIKDKIAAQRIKVEPIQKQYEAEAKKLDVLHKKLEKYRLEHRMFYPLSRLAVFKDKASDIESICFVQKTPKGKFKTDWIFNDDLFFIYGDGTFKYSSYESGIVQYDKKEKRWVHDLYHSRTKLNDYVGFMKINFVDENDYQVEPPDMETYEE